MTLIKFDLNSCHLSKLRLCNLSAGITNRCCRNRLADPTFTFESSWDFWLYLHYPFWAHLFALKQSLHTSSRTLQFLLYNYYQSWGHNKGLETLTFISTCTARKGTLLAAKLAVSVMYWATFCIPFERESFYMKPVQSHPESETGNLSYSICSDTGTGLCLGLQQIHGCEVKLQLYVDSLRAFHTEPARQAKLQNKVYKVWSLCNHLSVTVCFVWSCERVPVRGGGKNKNFLETTQ